MSEATGAERTGKVLCFFRKEMLLFSRRPRYLALQNEIKAQSCGPLCIWSSKMIESAHSCRVCGKLEAYLGGEQSLESAVHLVWYEMVFEDLNRQQLDSCLIEAIVATFAVSKAESSCTGSVRLGRAR